MHLRPEVEKFAENMETVLQANDYKGGWREQGRILYFVLEAEGHLRGLKEAIADEKPAAIVLDQAIDTANFLMMVADLYEREQDLKQLEGT